VISATPNSLLYTLILIPVLKGCLFALKLQRSARLGGNVRLTFMTFPPSSPVVC